METVSAIIPVAGLSSRMEAFKPMLPLGSQTVLEGSITTFIRSGIKNIIVVTGHRAKELEPVIRKHKAIPVMNPDYRSGMFSSILTGIKYLNKSCNGFFVLPGDIPTIRPFTIRQVLASFTKNDKKIIYPVFKGQPGHPPLISASCIDGIQHFRSGGGLRVCLEQFNKDSLNIAVCDRGIHMDADTPGDYDSILDRHQTIEIPNPEECIFLMDTIRKVPEPVIAHCIMVAAIGVGIAKTLPNGSDIDPKKIEAAALLHDIARQEKSHADQGGELLASMGFGRIAEIVRRHMDLTPCLEAPLTDAEIVFFADKLTMGNRLETDFKKRFMEKSAIFKTNASALRAIQRRLEATTIILEKIKKALSETTCVPSSIEPFPGLKGLLFP